MLLSAQTGLGIEDLWQEICAHRKALGEDLFELRKLQEVNWVWSMAEEQLLKSYKEQTQHLWKDLQEQLKNGQMTPTQALWSLLEQIP